MIKTKIGIVGCGVIGGFIAGYIERELAHRANLDALCDLDKNKALSLSERLSSRPRLLSLEELVKSVDVVVEAASRDIAPAVAALALKRGKDCLVMSVGGLTAQDVANAEKSKGRLFVPSGALCGIDGVKAAVVGRVDMVRLTTRKPPAALRGAPYLAEKGIDLEEIKAETVIYEGSAAGAVAGFPKNINVSMVLSLAGLGAEKTSVRIIASPGFKGNSHEIEAEGEFGSLRCRTDNRPSPDNPRTSLLACFSAAATLKGILSSGSIGT